MNLELPVLDESRCVKCGDCVIVCPTECLEPTVEQVWLARPGDCVSCGLCAIVCPTGAIKLVGMELQIK